MRTAEALNNNGSTALHAEACDEQLAAAQPLIENGVILDTENSFGRTPLHGASKVVLLERGANGVEAQLTR